MDLKYFDTIAMVRENPELVAILNELNENSLAVPLGVARKGSKRGFALIDAEDLDKVIASNWSLNGSGYAQTKIDGKTILMHRLIMGKPQKGHEIDHVSGNRWDNRKKNLRFATKAENQRNRRLNSNNKSGYKGVFWDKEKQKWRSKIRFEGKLMHVGLFDEDTEAARAWDAKALELDPIFYKDKTNAAMGLI